MISLRSVTFVSLLVFVSATAFSQVASPQSPSVRFQNSPQINTPPGFSHAVVVSSGKMIFVSGQVGRTKEGQMAGKNDFRAQTAQAFDNLKAALAAAGATPEHLVKLNYYVVGLSPERLQAVREVRDRFINKAHPPTSTLVGVQALAQDDILIEVEAVAVVP